MYKFHGSAIINSQVTTKNGHNYLLISPSINGRHPMLYLAIYYTIYTILYESKYSKANLPNGLQSQDLNVINILVVIKWLLRKLRKIQLESQEKSSVSC